MPTWANCKNGSTGSDEAANNAAADLALFSSTSTAGYNYSSGTKEAGNGLWEAICYGRAHSYDSSANTYSYTLYVFAKKLNGYTSWGEQWKVVFYYRGNTYTSSGLTRYLNGSGETRLIASHTFTDLNCTPSTTSTIGAKVTGEPDTETYQTITLTDTMDLSKDTWTSSVLSDTSVKVNTTNKIGSRGVRHARLFQYKKASASSYTTAYTANYVSDNSTDDSSYTFDGLTRNTDYDFRVQFRLRNYNPSDETGNNPVPLTTSGLTYTTSKTTEKSDLSGSVSLGGSRQIGKTLTANVDNPDNATLAYQWSTDTNGTFSSGDGTQTVLSGETSSSLVVPTSALDKYIYCKVTFTKDNYNTKTIRKYTSAVAYRQPFSGSVTITGTNKMNGTLTASVTTTSGGTKTYQWWTSTSSTATSGTAISGATSSTFKVTSSQIGKYIGVTVKITQTNTYEAGTINDITSGTAAEIAPTVTAPTMKSSLTYAGSSLALINAGSVTGGTMYYYASTSSTTPAASSITSTSIPKGLPTTAGAAQTYHVWYKVTGSAGYTDVGVTKIGSVAVNPGTFTVTKVPYSGNYDGSAHKASIKVNLAGCAVKSGTASGTYGTTDSTSTTANTAVSLGATSRTNAGTTTVYYQVSKSYYKTVTGSTTITIAKVNPTYTAPTLISNPKYSGSAVNYVNAGSTSHGTIYYYGSTSSTTPTSVTSTSLPTGYPTTAGAAQTHYAWFRIVGDANHNDVAITKIGTSTAIQPGTFTVINVPYSGDYDGSAHKASLKLSLSGCTVKSGSASGTYGTTDSTSTTASNAVTLGAVTRTNAGTTTVYYQISKNYYTTVTGSTTITINKVAPTVTVPTLKSTQTYAGSALAYVNAGSVTGGTMYYYGSTSSTAPAASSITSTSVPTGLPTTTGSAQTYYAWYKVVGDANHTDVEVTKIGTSTTINPGTFTVTNVPYSGTYDGNAHVASIKVSLAGCTVASGATEGDWMLETSNTTANTVATLDMVPRTNAGVTNVYYRVTKSYYTPVAGSTTIFILPSISISASQDYLKGDYGVPSGTISYSLGGGVGTCTNITLTSNSVTILNNATIAASGSTHPKKIINTTVSYSISYKDATGTAKTLTGTKTVSFPYNTAFDYTYSHKDASGTKISGTTKGFINDGTDASKQFCLTAMEWNDMNKFLYSAAFRKNGWSATGLTAPNVSNVSDSQLTATIYNNAVTLAEKVTGATYNRVTSGSRITSEHFNGFRDIINTRYTVTFVLDGTSYTVDDGTTWKQFSDENGLNCASDRDGIWDADYNFQLYNSSGECCNGGDIIVSDTYVWDM